MLERHCSIPRDTRPFSPISIYVHRGLKQPNVSIPFTHATTLISYVHALHGDSIRYLVNSSHVLPTLYRKQGGVLAWSRKHEDQRREYWNWSSTGPRTHSVGIRLWNIFTPGTFFLLLENLNTLPYPNMYASSGPSWRKHPPAIQGIFPSSPFSIVIIYEPRYFFSCHYLYRGMHVVKKNLKDSLKGEVVCRRSWTTGLEFCLGTTYVWG